MDTIEERWRASYARMAEGVEALLCFDLGLTGATLYGARSYILDAVVRPEFEQFVGLNAEVRMRVMRCMPQTGVEIISAGLTEEEALRYLKQIIDEKGVGTHWIERDY